MTQQIVALCALLFQSSEQSLDHTPLPWP